MGKQVRINITTAVNVKAVKKAKRNGRDVIIVPSVTLPDNIIMNGIKYPPEEIEKAYASLNRTPAPLGHPMINGKFVSARDPEGINLGWIGAWNENVRRTDGRVHLDKVIDVEVANRSEGGKSVLAAIEKGEPINTSTGLLCTLEAVNGATDHKHLARNMLFDHDAILLNAEGAATPEQGVGMLVNAAGEEEEIEVINSNLEAMDQDIDWAGTRLVEAVRRKADASKWLELKDRILDALGLRDDPERKPATNQQETDMSDVTKEQFSALEKKVDGLADALKPETLANAIGTAVANAMKPLTDAHAQAVANQKATDDAEHEKLVGIVVKANVLDETTAKATPLATLRALAPKEGTQQSAAALNKAVGGEDKAKAFVLPKSEAK